LIRTTVGVDLSEYKQASMQRRLARRMALCHLTTLEDYVQLLRDDPAEVQALFEDLLIHVTSFFRDGDAFGDRQELERLLFPGLPVRPGAAPQRSHTETCSTT
jgi:two-component system CheB/CheR fusion protein